MNYLCLFIYFHHTGNSRSECAYKNCSYDHAGCKVWYFKRKLFPQVYFRNKLTHCSNVSTVRRQKSILVNGQSNSEVDRFQPWFNFMLFPETISFVEFRNTVFLLRNWNCFEKYIMQCYHYSQACWIRHQTRRNYPQCWRKIWTSRVGAIGHGWCPHGKVILMWFTLFVKTGIVRFTVYVIYYIDKKTWY